MIPTGQDRYSKTPCGKENSSRTVPDPLKAVGRECGTNQSFTARIFRDPTDVQGSGRVSPSACGRCQGPPRSSPITGPHRGSRARCRQSPRCVPAASPPARHPGPTPGADLRNGAGGPASTHPAGPSSPAPRHRAEPGSAPQPRSGDPSRQSDDTGRSRMGRPRNRN